MYLCSLSKIFAPGVRLGYLTASSPELFNRIVDRRFDAGPNILAVAITAEYLEGRLWEHCEMANHGLKAKRDAMLAALETELGNTCSWSRPPGGLFKSLIEHAINFDLEVPLRLVRVVAGQGFPYRHNYCRAWADAFDDFHYRIVETPVGDESWDALATRVLRAVPGLVSDSGAADAMDAYVAGPAGFTGACRRRLLECGLPEDRVKVDSLD